MSGISNLEVIGSLQQDVQRLSVISMSLNVRTEAAMDFGNTGVLELTLLPCLYAKDNCRQEQSKFVTKQPGFNKCSRHLVYMHFPRPEPFFWLADIYLQGWAEVSMSHEGGA